MRVSGFDAIVVTIGAGVRHLPELKPLLASGAVTISRGQSLEYTNADKAGGTVGERSGHTSVRAGRTT